MNVTNSDLSSSHSVSPFHEGERFVQEQMGTRDIEHWARKVIRAQMPDQHREFYAAQPFLVVSARDATGRPWATLLEGEEGFVSSPTADRLVIESMPVQGDALETAFADGAEVGILGIELATRRRNRVNGYVARQKAGSISFAVEQSFGNCPQYIRDREFWRSSDTTPAKVSKGRELTANQKAWIEAADTFFIASGYRGEGTNPAFGMDVSHRGGDRGFVEVLNERVIRFPDYAGNNHYNTLGNLMLDSRAGFLFLDFTTGSLLQLTGCATVDWSTNEVQRFPGARQLVTFKIDEVVELSNALRLRWQEDAEAARSLRLVDRKQESADVVSLTFEARDGGELVSFDAGQHLPIELKIPGFQNRVGRSYSLSGSPFDDRYRISVKRHPGGAASNFLHDNLKIGAVLESRKPAGDFVLGCQECPIVLISAGIGITPMLSILYKVAAEESDRPIWFVHGARDSDHHPFRDEVQQLASSNPNIRLLTLYSRPAPNDALGQDYDQKGRVSVDFLHERVSPWDAHYFICGPNAFTAQIRADLEQKGIEEQKIHFETF